MHAQIQVVYENGTFRPLGPIPDGIQEHQHLTVTIEGPTTWGAPQAAEQPVGLDAVRQALAKVPGTLTQAVHDEREDR